MRLFAGITRNVRHALVCTALLCIAVSCLAGFGPFAHAQEATAAAQQEALALLREAARRTEDIHTLYATFTQEKQLSILDAPLTSSGYLCLERVQAGAKAGAGTSDSANTSSSHDRVLWAYEKPAPSGFAQEGGQSWLWAGEGASRRRAEGPEAVALKTVTTQIMAWIRIRPEELARVYRMERVYAPQKGGAQTAQGVTRAVPAPSPMDGNAPVLRLIPRQSGAFFSALEVTLNPTLDTVRQLRFLEKNGDSTVLTFHDSRVNAPMPAQCRPPKPLQ